MRTRVASRRRRLRRLASATIVVAVLGASALTAAAADLGGIDSGGLSSWSSPVSISLPPIYIADDPFSTDDCNGSLDGNTDSNGSVWKAHSGDWRYQVCDEIRVQSRVSMAHASLDLGELDGFRLTAHLTRISDRKNKSGPGIAFFSDGTEFMYLIYRRDTGNLELGYYDSSGISVLQVEPISDHDTAEISVELSGPSVTVLVDGVVEMTATIRDDVYAIYWDNTRYGLVADNDEWSRFNTFRVEYLR